MTRSSVTVVLTGAFLSVASFAAADDKPAPHGLGLLAGRVSDEAAREKLKAALKDPRPEVRAAAVRVINVSGVGSLVPAIVAALGTETDGATAWEMIRFLGALDRPELDQAILDAVRRLGPGVHGALADAFARRASAASHIPALRALGLEASSWLVFYDVATAGAAQSPGLAAAILRELDAVGWRASAATPEARGEGSVGPDAALAFEVRGWQPPRAAKPADASGYVRVETASAYPPSFVHDALAATRCDVKSFGSILGGEVTYRADGRPREVGLIQAGKSKECAEATRILLASSLAPVGVSTGERKSLLLLPDRPEFMQCMDEGGRRRGSQPRRPDRVGAKGGRIQEPKKVRDRPPQYPESARHRGAQGVVILEAEIEPSGCISQIELLRGVDTGLDMEAIRAVAGWEYTPTLLNGEPVPVIMTIAVNFKLSR